MKTLKVMYEGKVVAEGKTFLSMLYNAGVPENVLDSLPKDVKRRLFKSTSPKWQMSLSLTYVIDHLIVWDDTPQGHAWWSHLNNQAMQGKPLSPLPWPEGERDETINPQR